MKRRRPLTLWLGICAVVVLIATWAFVTYFDSFVSSILRRKLVEAVASGSHGEFELQFHSLTYRHGSIFCRGFLLTRVGVHSDGTTGEHGLALWRIASDSVRVTGVSLLDLVLARPLELSQLSAAPEVYLCNLDRTKSVFRQLGNDTAESSSTNTMVTLADAQFPSIHAFFSTTQTTRDMGTLWLTIYRFHYDATAHPTGLPFTIAGFNCAAPTLAAFDSSSNPVMLIENCYAHSNDSSIAVGRFLLHTGIMLDVRDLAAQGIDFEHVMRGEGLWLRSLFSNRWNVAYSPSSGNNTNHKDTNRNRGMLPFPVFAKHLSLENGQVTVSGPSHIETKALTLHATDVRCDSFVSAKEFHAICASFRWSDRSSRINSDSINLRATDVSVGNDSVRKTATMSVDPAGFAIHARTAQVACATIGWSKGSSGVVARNVSASMLSSTLSVASVAYRGKANDRGIVNGIWVAGIDYPDALAMRFLRAKTLIVQHLNIHRNSTPSNSTIGTLAQAEAKFAHSVSIPIAIGDIVLPNVNIRLRPSDETSLEANRLRLDVRNFSIDPRRASYPLFFSQDVRVNSPMVRYLTDANADSILVTNLRLSTEEHSFGSDSLIFSSMAKYGPQVRTRFQFSEVRAEGIGYDSLISMQAISLTSLSVQGWSIVRSNNLLEDEKPPIDSASMSRSSITVPISIGHVILPNGSLHFSERDTEQLSTSSDARIEATNIRARPAEHGNIPRIAADQLTASFTDFRFSEPGSYYAVKIHGFRANLQDSTVTMDSLGYIPSYSEQAWTAVHKYSVGRAHFILSDVRLTGVDCGKELGDRLRIRTAEAPAWELRYYKDERIPSDPTPDTVRLPNEFVRTASVHFTIDTIKLDRGDFQLRVRSNPDTALATMRFDSVSMIATPFSTDSTDPAFREPTAFFAKGIYLSESPIDLQAVYPLHDSGFDFSAVATIGPFDGRRLNDYLVHESQKKITSGTFEKGRVTIDVKNGQGTTTVTPEYRKLDVKILSQKPGRKPNAKDDVETLAANLFILRHSNPHHLNEAPVSAVDVRTRKYSDEFFGFLWDSIEEALGKVVGGFR